MNEKTNASLMRTVAGRHVAEGRFAGILWRVLEGDTVLDEGCVGHADHALERELAPDDLFRIYSMTKPVVSIAALMLVERGELALDDALSRYVGGFASVGVLEAGGRTVAPGRPITIEDLLTHRAGLSYDFQGDCAVAALYRERALAIDSSRSLEALVDELSALPLANPPGSRWYYSYATDVLARVLEIVCGRPLGELLRDLLFEPLGMHDTRFGVLDADRHRLVAMHGLRDLDGVAPPEPPRQWLRPMEIEASYPTDRPASYARGGLGLCSTRDDYLRFMVLLVDGCAADGRRLLSIATLEGAWRDRLTAAQRPIAIGDRRQDGYGWGLFGRVLVDPAAAGNGSTRGEGGWSGAASTWFWVERTRGIRGIVLAQYLGASERLGEQMQAAANGVRPAD